MLTEFVRVAAPDDLADGQLLLANAGGERIVLIRTADEYFAIGWLCSHAFGMLQEGELHSYEIQCPIHEGRFDIRTGEVTQEPPEEPIPTYSVHIEGDDIFVGPR